MRKKKVLLYILLALALVAIIVYFISVGNKSPALYNAPRTHTYNGITYEGNRDRYNKVVEKAARAKNPNICGEINFGQNHGDYDTSPEQSRYFCLADYATKTLDVDYCKTLDSDVKYAGSIAQRDMCLRDLSKELNDKNLCELLTNKIYCPK